MPKRGDVRLKDLSSDDAAAMARWLRGEVSDLAGKPDTLLTPGLNAARAKLLRDMEALLRKAARRERRGDKFTMLAPREAVIAVVTSAGPKLPGVPPRFLPVAVSRVVTSMRQAIGGPGRGRGKLTLDERNRRIDGSWATEPRWRRRLRKGKVADEKWRTWLAQVNDRGESLITTTLPSPKI
ncbi:hypothetical protein RNI52_08820 [Labrys neptuniae]|uniref:hypothetical protein n=1 Tax=Labrys neptuniae TaxID=376174 RepID=UPI00288C93CE|nr:hypothetical protein [Labrys neptuniae]MDT3377421.1 hypothetical protein [Labrys neptuniae]